MSETEIVRANKVCPVVLKNAGGVWQIMAFRHPLAGCQLVKGTIETGESAAAAALRELFEEAGICAKIVTDLGVWESGFENQIWSLQLCQADKLPDEWMHFTQDGGGLRFSFFWQPLGETPNTDWHPLYQKALAHIERLITSAPQD